MKVIQRCVLQPRAIVGNMHFGMFALLLLTMGCERAPASPADSAPGMIYVFPGINGGDLSIALARAAIRDGDAREIRTFRWPHAFHPLRNLTDVEGNRAAAERVAVEIATFRALHPNDPIDLIGYSGGGGIALLVAERLPMDVRVRNLILVQAAIDPRHDLGPALQHISGRLHNFCSPFDGAILGLGTRVFGNIDASHGDAAGRFGFDIDLAIHDQAQRCRFEQHPWQPVMFLFGHYGGHFGMLGYRWNRRYIAPLLQTRTLSAPGARARHGPFSSPAPP